MRKSVGAAAGAAILLVVVLVLSLTGAVLPSMAGSAQPNEATRALQGLNAASTALADAPGAKYNGIITLTLNSKSLKVKVTDLTVTAAGDVRGKVQKADDSAGDWLQLGGKTFAKGASGFWKNETIVKQPAGVRLESPSANKWVAIKETFLGIDLRAALRPSRLGLNLSQQDTELGTTELQGTAVGRSGETPDKRVGTGADPIGVSELEVEDADGGVDGARRYQAGSMTVGVSEEGQVVALRGPLGKGFGGDGAKIEADLTVQQLDTDAVRSAYSTMKSNLQSGKIGAWDVTVGEPTGSLDCIAGGDCAVGYDLTNTVALLDRGTVSVDLEATFKKGDRQFGDCKDRATSPVNGRAHVQCGVPFGTPADVSSGSKFVVTVDGELDPAVLDAAVTAGTKVAETAQGWAPTAPKATAAARSFNRNYAIAPSNYVYKIGDFAFDGRESDGTLLLVHGPGYEQHVLPDGSLDVEWQGSRQLLSEARDARSAAGDRPVRMVFAETRAADAVRAMLIANKIEQVEVVAAPN